MAKNGTRNVICCRGMPIVGGMRLSFIVRCMCAIMLVFFAFVHPVAAEGFVSTSAALFFSPPTQRVLEGAEFDVSLYLNTNGGSVNTIDIGIRFPTDKLAIVKPSTGSSLVRLWVEPPSYSNSQGTAKFVGVIPNGVKTKSGLLTTLTFRAIGTGSAVISVVPGSRVLANDGLGTEVGLQRGQSVITIDPRPPAGVEVVSESHPSPWQWSSRRSALFAWERDQDITDFSFVLDSEPFTVPDDISEGASTTVAYPELADGLWYFHVKARRKDVWGAVTHYLVRIDGTPPAAFTPTVDALDRVRPFGGGVQKMLISFFTTDEFAGVDHYEVAVRDADADPSVSPLFVQVESPYQLQLKDGQRVRVLVRAFDVAGNVVTGSVNIDVSPSIWQRFRDRYLQDWLQYLVSLVGVLGLLYVVGRHGLSRLSRVLWLLHDQKELQKEERAMHAFERSRGHRGRKHDT